MEQGVFEHLGNRLRYEVHGRGPRVLVFLHGLLLDAHLNRGIARRLAALGHRVVLLDLLGHGGSDKPPHASLHRMDRYADQVVALLDHLGLEQAVIGGVSLGANVTLEVAERAPERVRAMVVEMPVLEWAVPVAAVFFLPLLFGAHYGRTPARLLARAFARLPRTGYGPLDSFLNLYSADPDTTAAVLHGLFVGPVAPTVEAREEMTMPALVIGHERDLIHPFSDAAHLADILPNARLLQARSIAELRVLPARLVREIARFLDGVWAEPLRRVA